MGLYLGYIGVYRAWLLGLKFLNLVVALLEDSTHVTARFFVKPFRSACLGELIITEWIWNVGTNTRL